MSALPLDITGPTGRCLCGCGKPTRRRYADGHNPSDNLSRSRAWEKNDTHRGWKGQTITPAIISYVQRWLLRYGITSALMIERIGERNRVALRFSDGAFIHEAEVAALNSLRKQSPTAPMESVLLLFVRTA